MNSVGDTGGNICSELDSVVGSALFLKFFPKAGNEYCSKLEKEFRFQVKCTLNISYFLEFSLDI